VFSFFIRMILIFSVHYLPFIFPPPAPPPTGRQARHRGIFSQVTFSKSVLILVFPLKPYSLNDPMYCLLTIHVAMAYVPCLPVRQARWRGCRGWFFLSIFTSRCFQTKL